MFNNITMVGFLSRDPEVRETGKGNVCNMNLACSLTRKDKDPVTCFIDVIAWGAHGDVCAKFLRKGSKILVNGRLDMQKWQKDGSTRIKHKISADIVKFLDPKKSEPQGDAMEKFTTSAKQGDFMGQDLPF